MKKSLLIYAFLLLSAGMHPAKGQVSSLDIKENMIPFTWSQVDYSTSFSNPNTATADLFSKNGNHVTGIPDNYMGSQASPDGGDYVGIITYYGDFVRQNKKGQWVSHGFDKWSEYAYAALPTALVGGQEYTISFKVSLADHAKWATSGLGAFLSSSPITASSAGRLSQEPQVSSSDVIKDKSGWTEIKGTFAAQGGEKYIAIGAFDKNYTTEYVGAPYDDGSPRAYYYVSSISVEAASVKAPEPPPVVKHETPAPAPKRKHEVKADVKEAMAEALAGLEFESGKDVIKKSSYRVMDNVVRVMKDNTEYKLEINGYTDNVGNAKMNQLLSQKRAAAAAKYLTDRGVASNRLTTAGYGEANPVADNKTPEGRAKNRRVEFKADF